MLSARVVKYESFHSKVFCNCKEGVEIFLSNIYFSLVHEVVYRLQVSVLHSFQIDECLLMWVALQDVSEEGRTS